MAVSREDVVDGRVGDWKRAFDFIEPQVNPPELKALLNSVIHFSTNMSDEDQVMVNLAKINASLGLARLVQANVRAAGTIAAIMVANGVKPTSFDYGDDT